MKIKVVTVGIGGATCSGKTTLAKHLRRILPNSVIVHQDDFAPPQELVPIHPVYGVQDWDRAEGAIEWQRMIDALEEVKRSGIIPPEHISHDHLNEQKDIPIDDSTTRQWRRRFEEIEKAYLERGEEIKWVMVDGFLLYWHPEIVDQLDFRILLRAPEEVLKKRRHERHGYHTAVQTDPEGSLWRDPPNYWEQIVWPAYVAAHEHMLENGDVEHGGPNGKVSNLLLLDGLDLSMDEVVERVCRALDTGVKEGSQGMSD